MPQDHLAFHFTGHSLIDPTLAWFPYWYYFNVNYLARCVTQVCIVWTSKSLPFSVSSAKSLLLAQEVISRISLRLILLYNAFPARQCSLSLGQNCFVVLPINAYMKPSSSTKIIWWKSVLKFSSRDVCVLFFLYRALVDETHHPTVKQYSFKYKFKLNLIVFITYDRKYFVQ